MQRIANRGIVCYQDLKIMQCTLIPHIQFHYNAQNDPYGQIRQKNKVAFINEDYTIYHYLKHIFFRYFIDFWLK